MLMVPGPCCPVRSLDRMIAKLSDMYSEAHAQPFLPLLNFGVLEKDTTWIEEDICWACAAFYWDNVLNLDLIAVH